MKPWFKKENSPCLNFFIIFHIYIFDIILLYSKFKCSSLAQSNNVFYKLHSVVVHYLQTFSEKLTTFLDREIYCRQSGSCNITTGTTEELESCIAYPVETEANANCHTAMCTCAPTTVLKEADDDVTLALEISGNDFIYRVGL